jgi:mannosyltransferase
MARDNTNGDDMSGNDKSRQGDLIPILALTGFALLLRVWEINADLWVDEIINVVEYMRLTPIEAALKFKSANQHLLNSVLGSISIHLFGESTWSIRLPAMLFGVATIPVFYCLARRLTDRREAIFATLLLTVSYHHVWFSQNARGYSAMIFFTVLSTLLMIRCLGNLTSTNPASPNPANTGRKDWLWFSLSGALGMMSLLNFAFVLAGQFLAALSQFVDTRNWSRLRMLVLSGVLIVVLTLLGYAMTLPAIIGYFTAASDATGTGWQNPRAFSNLLATGWAMLVAGITGGLPGMALPALATGAFIVFTGWISYLRRMRFIALVLVLPVVFNIVVLAQLNWIVFPRSFLYVLPIGILILARGSFVLGDWAVRRFRSFEWVVFVLPVLLLAASLVILPHNYRYPKQNYSDSLAYTRAQAEVDDTVAVVSSISYGFKNFYDPNLAFPKGMEELDALRGPDHRVWVLYSLYNMKNRQPVLLQYIETEFERRRVFPGTLNGGTVFLAVSKARPHQQ